MPVKVPVVGMVNAALVPTITFEPLPLTTKLPVLKVRPVPLTVNCWPAVAKLVGAVPEPSGLVP